jgi:molybdopterin-biosynthesis enzyme MoeA-like protein
MLPSPSWCRPDDPGSRYAGEVPTAAALIIGDEILSGKFPDENGPYLIRRLRELGCDLRRLVVLSDDLEAIADEVARCRVFDHVITTGGVGPTHDDRTFEGVALGLGTPLGVHPELLGLLDRAGLERSPTNLRMCTIPEGSRLVFGSSSFPVVCAQGVWVFPGVPGLFQKKFEDVAESFRGVPLLAARRSTQRAEVVLAGALSEIAARFPEVAIGSYPRWGAQLREEELVVTLESRDPQALAAAVAALDDIL